MNKRLTGLNRYIYTFKLSEKQDYIRMYDRLSQSGNVTTIFINNGYAFEYQKPNIVINL